MRYQVLAAGCLLALSFASSAMGTDPVANATVTADQAPPVAAEAATAVPAPGPSIADNLLAEIDASVELAREGGYGRLKRGDTAKLEKARDVINELLEGHADPAQLPAEERLEVHNAQQLIAGILGKDNKDRVVCKRAASLGSRVAGTECMTVGQREARARASRENTSFAQRENCIPGETSSCN